MRITVDLLSVAKSGRLLRIVYWCRGIGGGLVGLLRAVEGLDMLLNTSSARGVHMFDLLRLVLTVCGFTWLSAVALTVAARFSASRLAFCS